MNLLLFTHKKISIKINIYKLLVEISGKMRVMRLFRIRIRVGWIWRIFLTRCEKLGLIYRICSLINRRPIWPYNLISLLRSKELVVKRRRLDNSMRSSLFVFKITCSNLIISNIFRNKITSSKKSQIAPRSLSWNNQISSRKQKLKVTQ